MNGYLFDKIMVRPPAILCCLLIVICPALLRAEIAAHAREHRQAMETGGGHSHRDGDAPHHEHDEDGGPIPVSDPTATMSGRLSPAGSHDFGHFLTLEPSSLPAPTTFNDEVVAFHRPPEQSLLRPPNPSPGDTLPLLI